MYNHVLDSHQFQARLIDRYCCHGAIGEGVKATSAQVFTSLWWGACAHADWAHLVRFIMASGKLRHFDHDRTLLHAGLHASFVNKGFIGNVHHFDGRGFPLSLPCGGLG